MGGWCFGGGFCVTALVCGWYDCLVVGLVGWFLVLVVLFLFVYFICILFVLILLVYVIAYCVAVCLFGCLLLQCLLLAIGACVFLVACFRFGIWWFCILLLLLVDFG